MAVRLMGHALHPPHDGEPWACACGEEYDWSQSEDYPGGIVNREEARYWHRQHVEEAARSPLRFLRRASTGGE